MKNKNLSLYSLTFCYCVFSLAMVVLPGNYSATDWINAITINCIIYLFLAFFLFDGRENLPVTDLICLVYILLLISKQIYIFNSYTRTYHRQITGGGNILLTVFIILMLSMISADKQLNFSMPVLFMLVSMFIIIFFFNRNKFNPAHLYVEKVGNNSLFVDVTLFDYIIPFNLRMNTSCKKHIKSTVYYIILFNILLIYVILFCFSCLKGDLMYSISPLQVLFQISSGELFNNFDRLFNYFLYFAYFSALLVNFIAYSRIKERFSYFNKLDLLAIVPLFLLVPYIDTVLWFILQCIVVMIIFFGRRKVKKYENL